MAGESKFGEVVTLLARDAPDELEKLRKRFPGATALLRPGGVMGGSASEIACAVTIAALEKYGRSAIQLLPRLRQRLAWSWRFDLVAKFAAACGSGGTIGALAAGSSTDKAIVSASVALLGSICTLLFAYLQRDEAAGSVPEAYNRLISALAQADELQRSLPPLCAHSAPTPELEEALKKANEVAKTLNELWLRFS
ncbi:hypothetical protein [Rhizobium leguminosarum]|uniref:hypothetical protein n=1 Tax=Rhizobium leguminosarum TaxID=384 RepID=UPI0024A94205|nr:hypothetical protein [Rhizobium leguminosarum]MDI5929012.1 hypothetical protein [Rhizobium leguminosarum]